MEFHSGSSVISDMDIKNALNAILPLQARPKSKVERSIKSDSTTDRDGNGQMPFGGQQQDEHGPMSDEQMEKALAHLKNLAIVKDHNLSVELVMQNGKKVVLIKEPDGRVVRRIFESELWSLKDVQETDKGQLLSKLA